MTTFQKLPIGAKFKLAGDNEVLIKVRDEGYESADNRLIHGDADPDYPVIRIEDCMESYPAAERAANSPTV